MSHRLWRAAAALSLVVAAVGGLQLSLQPASAASAASAATPPAKCLEVRNADTRRGALADQSTCLSGQAKQEWTPVPLGPGRFNAGIFQLRSALTGMCMEVYNGPTFPSTRDMRNKAPVDQWTCFKGHFNQEWDVKVVASTGRYGHPVVELVNHQSGKCLEVYNGPTGGGTADLQDGAPVDQWTCFPGRMNQEWESVLAPINGGIDFQLINENG